MAFVMRETRGMNRLLAEAGLAPDALRMHVSEIAPGTRSHAAHTHDAVEAFYVLEGQGVVEVGDEEYAISANEAIILDARVLHGIANPGATPLKYLVVITALPA